MKTDLLTRLLADRDARRPVVVLTWLDGGDQRLVRAVDDVDGPLGDSARRALAEDRAFTFDSDAGPVFVQPFNPPLRMAIVGAVHIAQHLAPMAADTGYAVTVIDPRSAFATPERFPGVELSRLWPDAALEAIGLDARCAVVTLTHDPKLDDPALAAALASDAFYVGSLGSRRTQARRLERMRALGIGDAACARIHGPVGLDIGARSPAEIAVSILAQVTAELRSTAG